MMTGWRWFGVRIGYVNAGRTADQECRVRVIQWRQLRMDDKGGWEDETR
jgi:hypothetical protein